MVCRLIQLVFGTMGCFTLHHESDPKWYECSYDPRILGQSGRAPQTIGWTAIRRFPDERTMKANTTQRPVALGE